MTTDLSKTLTTDTDRLDQNTYESSFVRPVEQNFSQAFRKAGLEEKSSILDWKLTSDLRADHHLWLSCPTLDVLAAQYLVSRC